MKARENTALAATRRDVISGMALGLGAAIVSATSRAEADGEIARNMESIHQLVRFKAPPARIYGTLTVAAEFQKVILLSDAVKQGTVKASQPAHISAAEGGEFSIFGGYISGRQIELVPNVRIVQAWRTGSWDAGIYSMARFVLASQGDETLLTFDHVGFPQGEAEHLAQGWHSNYWEPLAQVLR